MKQINFKQSINDTQWTYHAITQTRFADGVSEEAAKISLGLGCLICEPIDLQENESNCEVDYAVESHEQCTLNKTNLISIDQ